jgi:hypothetical protein
VEERFTFRSKKPMKEIHYYIILKIIAIIFGEDENGYVNPRLHGGSGTTSQKLRNYRGFRNFIQTLFPNIYKQFTHC